ncbi:hypothetical protein [Helicobacter vulpis]|uniref:hypothetical protein n=1 Tax=Helicobacter vulpis TaxID=2316076 RepID=UPI000EB2936A|nr:hypothetical protein [Helicobacter vulpis]
MKKHVIWPWFVIPSFLGIALLSFWFIARLYHVPPKSASFPLEKEAFYQASQSLYDSILKAVKKASKEATCNHVDTAYYDANVISDHAKTWIKLATQMVDALPTIKQIQSSLPKPLATRIRSFEILHAFFLVRDKIPGVSCYSDLSPDNIYADGVFNPDPLDKEALLENFSTSLKLVYALLIQSAQQGLDVNTYLHFLGQQASVPKPHLIERLGDFLEDSNLALANPTIFTQLKTLYSSARPIPGLSLYSIDLGHYTGQAYYDEMFKPLGLDVEFFQALSQYYMVALYVRADGLQEIANQAKPLEQILKSFPHLCFNTALSKEMKGACRDVLARPNAPLQDYLRHFRLIGFDDQPCLYLTPQNTIQTFRSKNPLCRALQAHPPNMGAPLPKDLMAAFQNAQDFLKNAWNSPVDKDDNPHPPSNWFLSLQQRIRAILQATPLASLQDSKWAYLLDYESLHLLALLQGSIAQFNPSGNYMAPLLFLASTPAPLLAQKYMRLLDFIYTPLIQAHQQGLDPNAYLGDLKTYYNPTHVCETKDACALPADIPPSPWLEDFKSAQLAWDLIQDKDKFYPPFDMRDWRMSWYDAQSRWSKSLSANQQQAFKLWDLHYRARVEMFFLNKDYYTDTLKHPERLSAWLLRTNLTPCFTPKYLSPASVQNCQHIFNAQSFSPSAYRDYLTNFRLLSVGNSPCLYLHTKDQLRGFNPKTPLCKALQAWALYSPPKAIILPPLFLQSLEIMRTRLEEALQKAYQEDSICKRDRAYFLQGVLPQLEQQAQSALESLPLLANFKPNNDKEKALLKRIQQQAMSLLFALLEGGSKDNCPKSPPTPTKQIAQTFMRALNFIYQPLMRARTQGLDVVWYVHTLARIQEFQCAEGCKDLDKRMQGVANDRSVSGNIYDGRIAYTIYQDFDLISLIYDFIMGKPNPHLGYNLLNALKIARTAPPQQNDSRQGDRIFIFSLDKNLDMHFLGSTNDNQALDLSKEGIATMMDQQKPLRPVNFFALRRVAQFLENQGILDIDRNDDLYNTSVLYNSLTFFSRYPGACLRPEYLRVSTQSQCVQIFKSERYDVATLKEYLQNYIMVSLQGVPCLYLDKNKQIKGLGSSSKLCQSLLKPLSQKGWFYHDEGH